MANGSLIQVGDYWLPDYDEHFPPIFSRGEIFEADLIHNALSHCSDRRVFLDVGAHVGVWSKTLAAHFGSVYAFEPAHRHQHCLKLNTPANVYIYPVGIGETFAARFVNCMLANTGMSHIDNTGQPVIICPLDSFGFENVDLLKIDTEGFELFVLQGAKQTIERCKPVVVIENYGWSARYGYDWDDAAQVLLEMGYRQHYREEVTKEEIWLPSP